MLLTENEFATNEEVVPVVESDIFNGHDDKRFAIGVFGPEDVLAYESNSLLAGYLKLRANVYIDQQNILSSLNRRGDGTEINSDDERSAHFVAFENRIGGVAVFASMRLIEKRDENDLLPIEDTFHESLYEPINRGSIEISRFIVKHDEATCQSQAKLKIIMAGLAYSSKNNLGPLYGEVEKRLRHSSSIFGVPAEEVSEPEMVEEGGAYDSTKHKTELVGIRILTENLRKRIGKEALDKMYMKFGEFKYWGDVTQLRSEDF